MYFSSFVDFNNFAAQHKVQRSGPASVLDSMGHSSNAGPDLCTLHPDLCTLHLWCFPSFNCINIFIFIIIHVHDVTGTLGLLSLVAPCMKTEDGLK